MLTTVSIPSTMHASLLLFRCENSWLEIPTIHGRRQERATPPQTHGRVTLNTHLVTTDSGTRHIRPKRSAKILSSFKFQRDRKQPATRPHVHSSAKYGLSYFAGKVIRQKGGSVGCTENTEVRCRERMIRSDEDTALIRIESRRICQENLWVDGKAPRNERPTHHKDKREKANSG